MKFIMAYEIPGFNTKPHIIFSLLSLILVVFVIYHLTSKECIQNTDCGPNAYCGVDDTCYEFPVQEQQAEEVVKEQNAFILSSIVISILLIIGSIIFVKHEKQKISN